MNGQLSLWDWMPEAYPQYVGTDWEAVARKAIIKHGSAFENGHHRIRRMLETEKLTESFLSREYGVGGGTLIIDEYRGFIDYSPKGLQISFRKDFEKLYSWKDVLRIWKKAFYAGEIHYRGEEEYSDWVKKHFKTVRPHYDGPDFPGWGTLFRFAKGELNNVSAERTKDWIDTIIAINEPLDAPMPYTWLNQWIEEYKREKQVADLKRVLPVPRVL